MKMTRCPTLYSLLLAGSLIFLSGCATPLSVQSDGKELASIIGKEPADIRFLSYCYYSIVQDLEGKSVKYAEGILVLEGSQLHLLDDDIFDENLREEYKSEEVVIPISEIEGVGVKKWGLGLQVQLLMDGYLIMIQLLPNRLKVSHEETQKLHDFLNSDGVPEWACEKFYHFDIKVPLSFPIDVPLPFPF